MEKHKVHVTPAKQRKKLIIFGAAKFVHEISAQTINFDNAEIVAFSDNNSAKWDIVFEGIEIIRPEEIVKCEFEYVLIGAWYSYAEIKQQLVRFGIAENMILPLLEQTSIRWIKDKIVDIEKHTVTALFRNSENLISAIKELNEINSQYEEIEQTREAAFSHTEFLNYPLIAHACGGQVHGKKREYTNSLEAFNEAVANGFKMFECDVWGVQNGEIILGSRLKMQYPIETDYTVPTLHNILEIIADDIEKRVILDIKYNTMEDFYRILDEVERLVSRFQNFGFDNIKNQILIETFDEKSSEYASSKNWECLLTDYRNGDGRWIKKSAVICAKYKIKTLMIDAGFAGTNAKYVQFLHEKNFNVVCYTVDDIEIYAVLKNKGVSGCLTNFLKPVSKLMGRT